MDMFFEKGRCFVVFMLVCLLCACTGGSYDHSVVIVESDQMKEAFHDWENSRLEYYVEASELDIEKLQNQLSIPVECISKDVEGLSDYVIKGWLFTLDGETIKAIPHYVHQNYDVDVEEELSNTSVMSYASTYLNDYINGKVQAVLVSDERVFAYMEVIKQKDEETKDRQQYTYLCQARAYAKTGKLTQISLEADSSLATSKQYYPYHNEKNMDTMTLYRISTDSFDYDLGEHLDITMSDETILGSTKKAYQFEGNDRFYGGVSQFTVWKDKEENWNVKQCIQLSINQEDQLEIRMDIEA